MLLTSLILLAPLVPPAAATGAVRVAPSTPARASADEFGDRYREARRDVDRLWELYEWCSAPERAEEQAENANRTLRRIVAIEPDHPRARRQLGHVREDGLWFESERALARHRRISGVEAKKARGFVRYRRDYVHPDAVPRLRKGLRFDVERGMWLDARERRRLENGWRLQDEAWIRPADVERMDAGMWLVEGDWVPLERAEQLRSKVDRMWVIPGASVRLHTTVRREVAQRAIHEMNGAIDDLRLVFGVEPLLPLDVCLLRTEEQYDRLAVGDTEGRRAPTHARGMHVAYGAFFAESWFRRDAKARAMSFSGMGVSYWNEDFEHGDLYGVHSARLAAALGYVDGIDPSRDAVREAIEGFDEGGIPDGYAAAYEREKVLPAWLRWGGAVYAERFFIDVDAAEGHSRTWPREWSIDNLRSLGGLGDIDEVLSARIDPAELEATRKLMIERGLLVAFLVDGGSLVAEEAHAELKRALASRDREAIVEAADRLEIVLKGQRSAILAFAGLE